jgi:NADP-dependent 3-hydroxy acid dehydrogenase YdfG
MFPLSEVIASNKRIAATFSDELVAVFVGGTSGVGEYTLKAFARYATKLRLYIVGRSQESADRIIRECKQLNPDGKFEFIKADVSLMKSVDDVCRQIKSKETAINILFESQGSMAYTASTSNFAPFPFSPYSKSVICTKTILTT